MPRKGPGNTEVNQNRKQCATQRMMMPKSNDANKDQRWTGNSSDDAEIHWKAVTKKKQRDWGNRRGLSQQLQLKCKGAYTEESRRCMETYKMVFRALDADAR